MIITTVKIPVATIAALLLGRFTPMAPHHVGALRELLGYINDDELREVVMTGKVEVTP